MRGGWMTRSVDGGLRIPGGTARGRGGGNTTRNEEASRGLRRQRRVGEGRVGASGDYGWL